MRSARFEVGPFTLANAGAIGETDLPRGESQPYRRGLGKRRCKPPSAKRPAAGYRESGVSAETRRRRITPRGRRGHRKRTGHTILQAVDGIGVNTGNGVGVQPDHAGSGLRRNRSPEDP